MQWLYVHVVHNNAAAVALYRDAMQFQVGGSLRQWLGALEFPLARALLVHTRQRHASLIREHRAQGGLTYMGRCELKDLCACV